MLGFPIRTSADRGLVDGSPQLFAVTHVLLRFLAPRHPPLALCSLENIYDRSFELVCSSRSAGRSRHHTTRCSCLLCSSQGATWTHAEHRWTELDAAASEGSTDSFKTEEKTVAAGDLAREEGRIPTTLEVSGRQPTSAPTRCVSDCIEQTSMYSRESTP